MASVGHTHGVSGEETRLDLEDLLNPDEQQRFRRLCLETSADELLQLTAVVELHLSQIEEVESATADKETAKRIATSLDGLITSGDDFDASERSLIRGAVEYFLLADDASGDLDDALGFDDDARVLNSVLDRIGRPQYRVELG